MSIARTWPMAGRRPAASWYVLALGLLLSLIVAEYTGPIAALSLAIALVGIGLLANVGHPLPRFPTAGYWLVGILVLGIVAAVAANLRGELVAFVDLQRDLAILISTLLFLVAGYVLAYDRRTLQLVLGVLVAVGVLISVVHVVRLTEVLASGVTDLYLFRLEAGRGSNTQFAALCACLILRPMVRDPRYRSLLAAAATLVALSMIMTLSRGLIVLLVVLVLGLVGLTTDRLGRLVADLPRFAVAVVSVSAAVVGLYVVLMVLAPSVYRFVEEFFVARVANSLTEVAATRLETRDQIAENYRAFETGRTLDQVAAQPAPVRFLGQGWGSTVRFGFDTASSQVQFSRTEAAFLHNGYAYYLLKTGFVGIGLYLAFLGHLFHRSLSGAVWPSDEVASTQRKVLFAGAVGLALGSITTGGLGYPAGYLGLVLLLGICLGPARDSNGTSSGVRHG